MYYVNKKNCKIFHRFKIEIILLDEDTWVICWSVFAFFFLLMERYIFGIWEGGAFDAAARTIMEQADNTKSHGGKKETEKFSLPFSVVPGIDEKYKHCRNHENRKESDNCNCAKQFPKFFFSHSSMKINSRWLLNWILGCYFFLLGIMFLSRKNCMRQTILFLLSLFSLRYKSQRLIGELKVTKSYRKENTMLLISGKNVFKLKITHTKNHTLSLSLI